MTTDDLLHDPSHRDRMVHRTDWLALVTGGLFLTIAATVLVDRLDVLRVMDGTIWPFLLIGAGLILLATLSSRDRRESRTIRPLGIDDLEPEYRLGAGTLRLDLRQLDLAGEDVDVSIGVGLGDAVVAVPADVPVDVEYHVGMGDAHVLGRRQDGMSVNGRERQGGDPSRGTLTIRADVRVGDLKVTSPRSSVR